MNCWYKASNASANRDQKTQRRRRVGRNATPSEVIATHPYVWTARHQSRLSIPKADPGTRAVPSRRSITATQCPLPRCGRSSAEHDVAEHNPIRQERKRRSEPLNTEPVSTESVSIESQTASAIQVGIDDGYAYTKLALPDGRLLATPSRAQIGPSMLAQPSDAPLNM